MATLVCFHAHPDDECIGTGGVMAAAADRGHRVVLVVATGGELGESPDDLAASETLAARRREETLRSAKVLGVQRVEWLGYHDSGMAGWEQNEAAGSFWKADLDEAAARLAAILSKEQADVVTFYDANGGYGHPDHIKVNRVGHRGAELAGTSVVYEATWNREEFLSQIADAIARGEMKAEDLGDIERDAFGTPAEQLTTAVDVSPWLERKREALRCHNSQVTDTAFLLGMPPEAFARAFGIEWFIRRDAPPGIHEYGLAGLDGDRSA